MIARLVLLCILFVWNGCYGCCSGGEPRIPKSVRKVLALEQLQARIRADRAAGVLSERKFLPQDRKIAKKMSTALLATNERKWRRYFEIAHPGDEETLARIAYVQLEQAKIAAQKFKLSWLDEHTLNQEAKNADAKQFRVEQSNRLIRLAGVTEAYVGTLTFDGYKSHLTDHSGVVINNETVLSLKNSHDLQALFPPVIISMIGAYTPGRVFQHAPEHVPLTALFPIEGPNNIRAIGVHGARAGYHMFTSTDFRYQEHVLDHLIHIPKPLSMTFIPEKELVILCALRREDFAKRIEQYRAVHPGIPEHAVAERVLAQENERLEAVGKQYNLSADTIQRAKEDTLIVVPSWEEIQLMRDRTEGALYTKKSMTLPVEYQVVTVLDEQKGDEE